MPRLAKCLNAVTNNLGVFPHAHHKPHLHFDPPIGCHGHLRKVLEKHSMWLTPKRKIGSEAEVMQQLTPLRVDGWVMG